MENMKCRLAEFKNLELLRFILKMYYCLLDDKYKYNILKLNTLKKKRRIMPDLSAIVECSIFYLGFNLIVFTMCLIFNMTFISNATLYDNFGAKLELWQSSIVGIIQLILLIGSTAILLLMFFGKCIINIYKLYNNNEQTEEYDSTSSKKDMKYNKKIYEKCMKEVENKITNIEQVKADIFKKCNINKNKYSLGYLLKLEESNKKKIDFEEKNDSKSIEFLKNLSDNSMNIENMSIEYNKCIEPMLYFYVSRLRNIVLNYISHDDSIKKFSSFEEKIEKVFANINQEDYFENVFFDK